LLSSIACIDHHTAGKGAPHLITPDLIFAIFHLEQSTETTSNLVLFPLQCKFSSYLYIYHEKINKDREKIEKIVFKYAPEKVFLESKF
jgi:hypothetical protein